MEKKISDTTKDYILKLEEYIEWFELINIETPLHHSDRHIFKKFKSELSALKQAMEAEEAKPKMSAEDILSRVTSIYPEMFKISPDAKGVTFKEALQAMHEYAYQVENKDGSNKPYRELLNDIEEENPVSTWECPRCYKINSYLKMSCDCPPTTGSANTSIIY
jgi:hypothetical protein